MCLVNKSSCRVVFLIVYFALIVGNLFVRYGKSFTNVVFPKDEGFRNMNNLKNPLTEKTGE